MARASLVAANWKMNGSRADNERWLQQFCAAPAVARPSFVRRWCTCRRSPRRWPARAHRLGAQNVSERPAGAWTGEVSAEMLLDVGAGWVIVGHSERRAAFGETSEIVAPRPSVRWPAACGRSCAWARRSSSASRAARREVIFAQLAAVLQRCPVQQLGPGAIAYEPVWAIGTGRTATPEQAQEVHAAIRAQLAGTMRPGAAACASCTVAASNRRMRASCFRSPTSTAA
jgi:triosephosphate isomerase (TIM)